MAKYEISQKCGHTSTFNIGGPLKDRERKEAWLAEQTCRACQQAEVEAARNEAAAKAAAKADEQGLPQLQGSEKQVRWALTIRAGIVETIESLGTPRDETALKVISHIKSQAAAGWWIDRRDADIREILTEAVNSVKQAI